MNKPITHEQQEALAQIKALQAEYAKKALLARDVSSLTMSEREAAWRDQYNVSAELRTEFRELGCYLAYKKAQFAGLTK
jgi:hypothetical protein